MLKLLKFLDYLHLTETQKKVLKNSLSFYERLLIVLTKVWQSKIWMRKTEASYSLVKPYTKSV